MSFARFWIIGFGGFVVLPFSAAGDPQAPKFEPTSSYEKRTIEGWPIVVNKGLLENEPELAAKTLELLRHQLYQVERVVPANRVRSLKTIPIWVEANEKHHPCMAYHPNAGWLRDHDMNPEKAKCVEIANAETFLKWTRDQPWMVLHELAHGYHDRFLSEGYANKKVERAYKSAVAAGRYDSVLRIQGQTEKAYAATNPMEYFAEATEAYFGVNDFYPFVRIELEKHDPAAYALMRSVWSGD